GGTEATNVSGPTVSPEGPDTQVMRSTYDLALANPVRVVEEFRFTNGTRDVRIHYAITNESDGTATYRAGELSDLYVGGSDDGNSDAGFGVLAAGPPRLVGIQNAIGGIDGLVEVTPWSTYQAGYYGDVFSNFDTPAGLNGLVDPEETDAGAGAQWDFPLASGATKAIDVTWRFGAGTTLPPPAIASGAAVSGSTVTLSGTAEAGSTITIYDGATPVTTTSAPQGTWSVTLSGVSPGTHRYTAVASDFAGNRSAASAPRDVVVPGTAAATPTPTPQPQELPPPVVGKEVNAATKSGKVRIKVPGSNKFIELGPEAQIPTGTTVDATHGRITLTTAVGGGATQHADFYQGIFKVTQSRGAKPLTTLTLSGPKPTCITRKAHASAALKKKKVKTRKLWGSGSGAFRTSGQYSSATVRGTTWLTQDSCAGTLTKVTSGVVSVRDLARRKTVLVRKGHSYLARARRR
ncbi:MAG: Ig-like domain-containing protein, partial [Solirubrobacterales bacterium]